MMVGSVVRLRLTTNPCYLLSSGKLTEDSMGLVESSHPPGWARVRWFERPDIDWLSWTGDLEIVT